jgi:hypothetical protein
MGEGLVSDERVGLVLFKQPSLNFGRARNTNFLGFLSRIQRRTLGRPETTDWVITMTKVVTSVF